MNVAESLNQEVGWGEASQHSESGRSGACRSVSVTGLCPGLLQGPSWPPSGLGSLRQAEVAGVLVPHSESGQGEYPSAVTPHS